MGSVADKAEVADLVFKSPDFFGFINPKDLVKRENPEELISQAVLPAISKQLAQISAQMAQISQFANGRAFVASSERPDVGQGAVQSGSDSVNLLEQRIAKLEQAAQNR